MSVIDDLLSSLHRVPGRVRFALAKKRPLAA